MWYLFFAIIFEVAGTVSMKLSGGFQKLVPSIGIFLFYGIAFTFLTFALKKMDVTIAYAVWSGLGTVLICLIGFVYFSESVTFLKILFIGMIVMGAIGLNLISRHH